MLNPKRVVTEADITRGMVADVIAWRSRKHGSARTSRKLELALEELWERNAASGKSDEAFLLAVGQALTVIERRRALSRQLGI